MKLVLENNFHHNFIVLHPRRGTLSPRQVRKSWAALCGYEDCKCGGYAGERGPQVQSDGRDIELWPIEYDKHPSKFPACQIES